MISLSLSLCFGGLRRFLPQATKPDTVGVALSDSPAGLAAYILEKFAGWTDKSAAGRSDGGLAAARFGLDRLLTNVMVYWVTNSITTSMRVRFLLFLF